MNTKEMGSKLLYNKAPTPMCKQPKRATSTWTKNASTSSVHISNNMQKREDCQKILRDPSLISTHISHTTRLWENSEIAQNFVRTEQIRSLFEKHIHIPKKVFNMKIQHNHTYLQNPSKQRRHIRPLAFHDTSASLGLRTWPKQELNPTGFKNIPMG